MKETDEGTLLYVLNIEDDASGEQPIENLVSKAIFTVTDEHILENGNMILKLPLEVDNQWTHKHMLKDSGEVRYATTRIVKIEDDTITTETQVDNVFGYPNETYIEHNTYSVGAGYINRMHSVHGIDALEMGYFIYQTYRKPYNVEAKSLLEPFDVVIHEGKELKAYPIVAYDNYLIGGSFADKWMGSLSIAPKLIGQETYKIYGLNGYIGEGLGATPIKELDGFEWQKVDVFDPYGAPIIDKRESFTKYGDYFSSQIAVSTDWDPMPRRVQQMKVYNETYRDIVNDFLNEIDMVHVPVQIEQILKTDLEGDGTDEVIITASTYGAPLDFMSAPDRYSIVILRKIIDGNVQNILLAGDYHKANETDGLNYVYYVPFILDLNGDGRMEIVTEGMYYEGQWLDIIEVNGDEIQSVLADGPQL